MAAVARRVVRQACHDGAKPDRFSYALFVDNILDNTSRRAPGAPAGRPMRHRGSGEGSFRMAAVDDSSFVHQLK
ncbi:hypothetical protein ACWDWU_16250 [Streptomyces sp. NPDC003442]